MLFAIAKSHLFETFLKLVKISEEYKKKKPLGVSAIC